MSKSDDRTTGGRTGTTKAHQSHCNVLMATDRQICLAWSSGRQLHAIALTTRMPGFLARPTSGLDRTACALLAVSEIREGRLARGWLAREDPRGPPPKPDLEQLAARLANRAIVT